MEIRLTVQPDGGKRGYIRSPRTGKVIRLDSRGARRLPKGMVKEAVEQLRASPLTQPAA